MQERFQVFLLKRCWFNVLCDWHKITTSYPQARAFLLQRYNARGNWEKATTQKSMLRYYFCFAFLFLIYCELSCPRMNIFHCQVFQYFLLSLHNWANRSHVGEALISIEPPHLHPALRLSSQHPEQDVRQGGDCDENWSNDIKYYQCQKDVPVT